MNFLRIAARITAGKPLPEDLEELESQDEQKFKWNSKPGSNDWFPLCVVKEKPGYSHGPGPEETLKDGDIITWTGNRKFEKNREKNKNEDGATIGWIEYDNEFREVVTPSGFVGWVYWTPLDSGKKHGFEPVN